MRILIVLLFTIFLTACSSPLGIESTPEFVAELDSEITGEKKIKPPRGKGKRLSTTGDVHKKNVQDIVIPPPPPPVKNQTPPAWVADLKDEVEVKKIGKGRREAKTEIGLDLAGETEIMPVVAEEPESIEPPRPIKLTRPGPTKVDIIFVVDSSISMRPFLTKIKKTFAGFISTLDLVDWQIIFTKADGNNTPDFIGKAMSLERDGYLLGQSTLKRGMRYYKSIFMDTLRQHNSNEFHNRKVYQGITTCDLPPGCQNWDEQPLTALASSFKTNRSFFRPGADVAAVIFSDSDEGEFTDPEKRTSAQNVIKSFNAEWGIDAKRFIAYGIIMIPGKDQKCIEKYSVGSWGGEGLFGIELARLAELTGGKSYSLCDSSYTSLANQITLDFNK